MEAKESFATDTWKVKSVPTEITQKSSVHLSESAYTAKAEYITKQWKNIKKINQPASKRKRNKNEWMNEWIGEWMTEGCARF